VSAQTRQRFERLALAAAPFGLKIDVKDLHSCSLRSTREYTPGAWRLTNPARQVARIGDNNGECGGRWGSVMAR
jgi:hypothetical protein